MSKNDYHDIQYDNYTTSKKNAIKLKSDDFNHIIKLMNEISESSAEIKRLRNDIKKQVTIFKKNTNNIYRNTKTFRNGLDKKYKEDINAYLLSISSSEEFEKSVVSKNIYKDKITELHKIIHKQILDMGIPDDAFESLKFYSKMKTQFEKNNNIFIDDYHNEIYNIINKNIKKVNNNIILTI
jgi:competence CoiA-like predicted nuclease